MSRNAGKTGLYNLSSLKSASARLVVKHSAAPDCDGVRLGKKIAVVDRTHAVITAALARAGSTIRLMPVNFLIFCVAALFSAPAIADPLADLAALLQNSSGWTAPKALVLKQKQNGSVKLMVMRNYTRGARGDGGTAQVIVSLDKPAPPPQKAVAGVEPPDAPNLTVQGFSGYYEETGPIHRITFSLCESKTYSCAFMASGSASKEQLVSLVKQLSLAKVGAIAAVEFR
jgi:hypothetical protein